jgi:hypothetical protein
MAVRFVVMFLESAFCQLLQTERTDKVLRMELSEHGCDASTHDWFMASSTE